MRYELFNKSISYRTVEQRRSSETKKAPLDLHIQFTAHPINCSLASALCAAVAFDMPALKVATDISGLLYIEEE